MSGSAAATGMIWVMMGLAVWHLTVFLPDRFPGGIGGALVAAVAGAAVAGFLLPEPGLGSENPPGLAPVLIGGAGAVAGLAASLVWARLRRDSQPPSA